MRFMRTLLTNHPLVNILFSVVLVMGAVSYLQMPREKDPEINFNVVSINTMLPGSAAIDVEQLVTDPLEDALRNVRDIRFIRSSSRENISDIMVRFRDLSPTEFDKRITDLRREIQSKANDELPDDAEDPYVIEITSSNGFPTAIVVVTGQADDERLRRQGKLIKEELKRIPGIDTVFAFGFDDPELQVEIIPRALCRREKSRSAVSPGCCALLARQRTRRNWQNFSSRHRNRRKAKSRSTRSRECLEVVKSLFNWSVSRGGPPSRCRLQKSPTPTRSICLTESMALLRTRTLHWRAPVLDWPLLTIRLRKRARRSVSCN